MDILDRLHDHRIGEQCGHLHDDAIAEIDRLRAEVEVLKALILHIADNAEFAEDSYKDWKGWIKHALEAREK